VLWRRLAPNDIYVAPSEIGWKDRIVHNIDSAATLGAALANRWHQYRQRA